ncbi:MAG: BlaI/MecI/CopY family transcriptional regulator [Fluviicola sp.]|jgi:predicted transcriptional regulator|nr:BlaI/MecI/CopY family transcriptional regulator [Fluviicola sp.]MBP6272930.1 BlaI/MecI/CopY family transcriptional regulator [Fluviicola sp.]
MERLTPAEEKVMLRLWSLEKAAVKDIVALYEQPRPAYNTISTIVRILEKKKFIKHKPVSRGHIYSARISKEEYRNYLADNLLKNYFEGSRKEVVSYFNSTISLSEML